MYAALFALVTGVALFSYRLTKRTTADRSALLAGDGRGAEAQQVPGLGAVIKVMPFMSFFTLVSVAVVPLAAALYIVTSATWSVVERAVLYR